MGCFEDGVEVELAVYSVGENKRSGESEIGGYAEERGTVCGGGVWFGWSGISFGAAYCRRDLLAGCMA